MPVSYTHLDVYKRQLIRRRRTVLLAFRYDLDIRVALVAVDKVFEAGLCLSLIHI